METGALSCGVSRCWGGGRKGDLDFTSDRREPRAHHATGVPLQEGEEWVEELAEAMVCAGRFEAHLVSLRQNDWAHYAR